MFEGLVEISDGKIYCKVIGNQLTAQIQSTIVVFPGGPGLGFEIYEGHSSCFSENAKMLFFDPRGSGKSTPAKNLKDYTLDNYVDDAKKLIDHFKMEKIIILGTSYGSMAALNFVIRYPELVEKLILVAGAPSHHFIEAAKEELEKRGTLDQKNMGKRLFAGDFETDEEVKAFFQIMSPLYSRKAQREGVSPYRAKCSIDPLNTAFSTRFDSFDYRGNLASITAETLILVGEDDWINPVAQARETAGRIDNSILITVKGAGHSVAVDAPETYRNTIKYFIHNKLCNKDPGSFLEAATKNAQSVDTKNSSSGGIYQCNAFNT